MAGRPRRRDSLRRRYLLSHAALPIGASASGPTEFDITPRRPMCEASRVADSSSLTICNWNMQQNPDAWGRLEELRDQHGVQIALLQEAVTPPNGDWTTYPPTNASDLGAIKAHTDRQRNFASVVAVLDPALASNAVVPQALGAAEYGRFAVSHPGQFSVAEVASPSGKTITVISLYGIWDRDDRYLFAEATLHRAISDLTILLQEQQRTNTRRTGGRSQHLL